MVGVVRLFGFGRVVELEVGDEARGRLLVGGARVEEMRDERGAGRW